MRVDGREVRYDLGPFNLYSKRCQLFGRMMRGSVFDELVVNAILKIRGKFSLIWCRWSN
jgi:hypothetical protein